MDAKAMYAKVWRKALNTMDHPLQDTDAEWLATLNPANGGVQGCEAAIGKRYGAKDTGCFANRGDRYFVALWYFRAYVLPTKQVQQ